MNQAEIEIIKKARAKAQKVIEDVKESLEALARLNTKKEKEDWQSQ